MKHSLILTIDKSVSTSKTRQEEKYPSIKTGINTYCMKAY